MFYTIEGRVANDNGNISRPWFECYRFPPGFVECETRRILKVWYENNKGFEFRLIRHTPVTEYMKEII